MEESGQFHAPAASLPGKNLPRTDWIGSCMYTAIGLEAKTKRKTLVRARNSTPVVQPLKS
jgi:hypothetical protein